MSNHLHFAFLPGHQELQSVMKRVNSPFARWLNERHERLGPVFADRPREWAIRQHKHPQLIAYIHNNPVRAGVVSAPLQSTWTSHRAYVGVDEAPRWLHVDTGLEICGFDRTTAQDFDAWGNANAGLTNTDLDLAAVRAAARKRGALELATPIVGERVEVQLVARPGVTLRINASLVVDRVCDVLGVDRTAMCSRSARPHLVTGRRIAIHVGVRLGHPIAEMARLVGISPQAGSKHAAALLNEGQRVLVDRVQAAIQRRVASPALVGMNGEGCES
jgi:hypothetical protein